MFGTEASEFDNCDGGPVMFWPIESIGASFGASSRTSVVYIFCEAVKYLRVRSSEYNSGLVRLETCRFIALIAVVL